MSSLFCSFPYKSPACLLKFIPVCIFICWAILNMYCRFYMLIANKKKKANLWIKLVSYSPAEPISPGFFVDSMAFSM